MSNETKKVTVRSAGGREVEVERVIRNYWIGAWDDGFAVFEARGDDFLKIGFEATRDKAARAARMETYE